MSTGQTPRQVVQYIEETFPGQIEHQFGQILLTPDNVTRLSAIAGLVDQIPNEFITLSEPDFTALIAAKAGLRSEIEGVRAAQQMRRQNLSRSFGELNVVGSLHQLLSQCPNTGPPPKSTELEFVSELDLREDLRKDRESCQRLTSVGEWKAATVLGGSVIEALLLWRLEQTPPKDVQTAKGGLRKNPGNNLERWSLETLIEISAALSYIEPETEKVCDVAREFRDLIHPGRAHRLKKVCDQATAMSVIAAISLVIRDLPKSL